MRVSRFAILLGLIIGIGCLSLAVFAQSINQTQIRGTVTDSSGAIVAGAKVTITDVGTNISQTTTSNASGTYAFTALRASNYKLLVEASAFGPVEKDGITLTVNQATTLNVTLKPASQQSTVTVEAIPVLLDSGTATLGADIPSKYLVEVPLQNRDPFGIAFLAAGVTESAGSASPIPTRLEQTLYRTGREIPPPTSGSTAFSSPLRSRAKAATPIPTIKPQ